MALDIFNSDGEELNNTKRVELCDAEEDYQKEMRKVKRKLKQYKSQLKDDFYCFNRKQRKHIKKKIRKLKSKKKSLQTQIDDIKRRLDEHDENIALIINELLRMKSFYRKQMLQRMAESDNPKVIESYLLLLESGDKIGKQI
ncbi:MAG: hypothetical protein IJG16_04720 [Clostridia bacterium]|nr:hypothetical protein [Clostridia bacterium]